MNRPNNRFATAADRSIELKKKKRERAEEIIENMFQKDKEKECMSEYNREGQSEKVSQTSNQILDGKHTQWARCPIQRECSGYGLSKTYERRKPTQSYLLRIHKRNVTSKHTAVKIQSSKI